MPPTSTAAYQYQYKYSIPLQDLNLRPSTLTLLQQRGFTTTEEWNESRYSPGGMANLAAELDVELSQAATLVREVEGCLPPNNNATNSTNNNIPTTTTSTSCSQLLHSRPRPNGIITFCRAIDTLLGGAGISLGHVTEIAGLPGTGKTQLAMQLCVDACLPREVGGVQGQAVYVDAEGSFAPERIYPMAQAMIAHVQSVMNKKKKQKPSQSQSQQQSLNLSPEQVLEGIHVFRVHDETAQSATLYHLREFIKQQEQNQNQTNMPVKLIVVDSIAFHYRAITPTDPYYYLQRTQQLSHLAAFLGELATQFQIAVVVLNQMTTKIDNNNNEKKNGNGGTTSRLVPALGESWAHATTTRLLLSHNQHNHHNNNNNLPVRTCTLVKSPSRPSGTAEYQICSKGIRDVDASPNNNNNALSVRNQEDEDEENDTQQEPSKRLRTRH
jgi:RAD51-like protein 2